MIENRYTLKPDCDLSDIPKLHPNVLMLLGTLLTFAKKRDLPVVITSLISDRENVQSISKTHEQGRAIDISVKGWSEKDIIDIQDVMKYLHKNIAAISSSTLEANPVVYHDYQNQGSHLHLQVRPTV